MAKKTKRPQNNNRRRLPINTVCPFCEAKVTPNYKNYQDLEKFMSERKKISNRQRTGVCSRHQRVLSREIKRARHLALLPFTPSVY